jgi:predicted DNA-binding transcriptional regulator AlpA
MDQLLDTRQAAAALTLSKSTLEKMRVYGNGPKFYKFGSAVRYKMADLQAWASERIVSSTSDSRGLRARSRPPR